jgi:hypothetical protein
VETVQRIHLSPRCEAIYSAFSQGWKAPGRAARERAEVVGGRVHPPIVRHLDADDDANSLTG